MKSKIGLNAETNDSQFIGQVILSMSHINSITLTPVVDKPNE